MSTNCLISNAGNKPESLEYNQKDYKEGYCTEFVTGFTHGSMANGPVDVTKVKNIVAILNEKVASETKAVSFKADLVESRLKGGACSSIAFRVGCAALRYLQNPEDGSSGLIKCVKDIIEKVNVLNAAGRKDVRNVQAAFNTIFVDPLVKVNDISQHKIKALAAYYDVKVHHSTDELIVEDSAACKKKFEELIENLKPGVYLLRILQKENNHKLETQGHSTIYIKNEQGRALYFDTQLGLYDLSKTQNMIYRSVCSAKKRFAVDTCQFHQLSA
jgi:hypothetical protein